MLRWRIWGCTSSTGPQADSFPFEDEVVGRVGAAQGPLKGPPHYIGESQTLSAHVLD